MDREKERKRIAGLIDDNISPELKADRLLDAGYGSVRRAVKEFGDKVIDTLDAMGMERSSEYNDGYDDAVADCITNIKSLLQEFCKNG